MSKLNMNAFSACTLSNLADFLKIRFASAYVLKNLRDEKKGYVTELEKAVAGDESVRPEKAINEDINRVSAEMSTVRKELSREIYGVHTKKEDYTGIADWFNLRELYNYATIEGAMTGASDEYLKALCELVKACFAGSAPDKLVKKFAKGLMVAVGTNTASKDSKILVGDTTTDKNYKQFCLDFLANMASKFQAVNLLPVYNVTGYTAEWTFDHSQGYCAVKFWAIRELTAEESADTTEETAEESAEDIFKECVKMCHPDNAGFDTPELRELFTRVVTNRRSLKALKELREEIREYLRNHQTQAQAA